MSAQPLELIYWPIRGLGSPIRAILTLNGVPFKDNRMLDWFEKDGTKSRVDKVLPFANLPTLLLPNGEALTQTATLVRYAGSLGETKPKNDIDEATVSMVIDHLIEFNGEKLKMTYGEGAKDNHGDFFEKSIPYYFGELEKWVARRGSKCIATDYITAADIFFAEYVDSFAKLKGGLSWMENHPKLTEIYKNVINHDKLKGFYEQEKSVPHNNPAYACWH